MTDANLVHEEWDSILVRSNHGQDVYYRIFYGTVNWDRSAEGMLPAVTTLMQYGGTTDWKGAKSQGEIEFNMPAHILREDLPRVIGAIQSLARKHGLEA